MATNQFGRLNWSATFPDASAITSMLGEPGAAEVVIHEDVDRLARLPIGARQRDEATGRVVLEVTFDRRRIDGN